MTLAGRIGLGLLVVGAVAIAVEIAIALWRAFRVRRALRDLRRTLAAESAWILPWMARRRELDTDLAAGLRPYRRVARLLTHPLSRAVIVSLRRRRAARA
ncbi:MAG: hypothetical protein ACREPA_00725 [Candidatus Dormibacteraceae bacterium]